MGNLVLQLPDDMKEFVDAEAAAAGLSGADIYVCRLIRAAQRKKAIAYLERLAEESLASGPMTPLTHEDFEDIRRMLREKYGNPPGKTA